jgi:2-succinyl-5-enolpyruvyl-6-hydroxy-3-cyclohexene-1-carboxylate synthase
MQAPNRNYVWTMTFVDELARCGLRHVVIAPGSRSTPLTMAVAQHPDIRVYSHIDERGAAFMALGLALASEQPAAVVCSSGTAAANFYPAIVEAHYAHVPLLILTADRPHELRDSGANQTVDQVKMYGDHVLWSVDVALPEAQPPAVALRNLRTLADRAYALADGMPKGGVHLNFPFRKPLEPTEVAGEMSEVIASRAAHTPHTQIERGVLMPTEAQRKQLKQMLAKCARIMIVCGPRTPSGDFAQAVGDLAGHGAVLLADGQSNVRYDSEKTNVIADYECFLPLAHQWAQPDAIIHFGAMPTTQPLLDYLAAIQPQYRIVISQDGSWTDFDHRIDVLLHADPVEVCQSLLSWWHERSPDDLWREKFAAADETASQMVDSDTTDIAWFDGIAVHDTLAMTNNANIFVASSLAVRHLDQYGLTHHGKQLRVFCNRGASGIDGTISSALGVAATDPTQPTVLIIGDLAFYHDMNALLAATRNSIKNFVIVLLNNNGGQIFRRLPINQPEFEPAFTELFLTPHGMTFEHTAAQFGFAYSRADDRDGFRAAFKVALGRGEPSIIEVVTDAEEDAKRRNALREKIAEAVKQVISKHDTSQ